MKARTPIQSREPRRRRLDAGRRTWVRTTVLIVTAVGAAAAVAVTVFWFSPATTVAESELTVRLSNGGASAEISLPSGWSWRAQRGDSSRGVAGSPDRVMSVEFALVDDADAVKAVENAAAVPLGPLSEEVAPDGARLLSARTVEPGAIAGALTEGSAVLTFVSTPSPEYDAELATVLAGAGVKS